MQDEKYRPQPDDEESSPFRNFIESHLTGFEDSDEEPVKNEHDAIRRVLEGLEKEHDVHFEVNISDDLNSRLGSVNAIFYLPDDVSDELQRNNLSDEQLQIISGELENDRLVMRATTEELKRMMEAVGDLMSYIELGPEQVFFNNQPKKFALLRVLLSSFQYIEEALSTKDKRDSEQIKVKEYLKSEAMRSVEGLRNLNSSPEYLAQEDEAVGKIQSLVEIIEKIDSSVKMPRWYLRRIDDFISKSVRFMGWKNNRIFAFDEQTLSDARIMLEELAEDYPTSSATINP